jgi:hypothetical protein
MEFRMKRVTSLVASLAFANFLAAPVLAPAATSQPTIAEQLVINCPEWLTVAATNLPTGWSSIGTQSVNFNGHSITDGKLMCDYLDGNKRFDITMPPPSNTDVSACKVDTAKPGSMDFICAVVSPQSQAISHLPPPGR